MVFHLGGWGETIDAAGALVQLTALADDVLNTSGDDLTVPELDQVIALAAGVASGGDGFARLDAPSLLRKTRFFISPVNGNADADAEPGTPPAVTDLRMNPLRLRATEDAQANIESDTTSAQFQWLLAWFSNGPVQHPNGEIFTVRALGTTTLAVDVWTSGQIILDDSLPAGRYQIVGMSAIASGLVAARVIFRGGQGWRPGCLGRDSDSDIEHPMFRYGGLGVWGEFTHNTLPSIEYLSISADTAEDILLDLIQVQAF